MKRSTFLKTAALASAAPFMLPAFTDTPAASYKTASAANSLPVPMREIKKPRRLKQGDPVGLIAPGCFISENELHDSIHNLESIGLRVVPGKYLTTMHGYFSGTDKERASDINRFFDDKDIRAIIVGIC